MRGPSPFNVATFPLVREKWHLFASLDPHRKVVSVGWERTRRKSGVRARGICRAVEIQRHATVGAGSVNIEKSTRRVRSGAGGQVGEDDKEIVGFLAVESDEAKCLTREFEFDHAR